MDETGKVQGLDALGIENLEPQLEATVSGYDGNWSVYVKDLETEEEFVINDEPMYSASLIKAFVMAKTFEDMDLVLENEAKQMKTDAANAAVQTKIDNLLTNMITVSDNESCNELGRLQSENMISLTEQRRSMNISKKKAIPRRVTRARFIRLIQQRSVLVEEI